jgi:hypothetical protein
MRFALLLIGPYGFGGRAPGQRGGGKADRQRALPLHRHVPDEICGIAGTSTIEVVVLVPALT